HNLKAAGEFAADRESCPKPEVIIRDRPGEENRPRIIPVRRSIDNFRAGGGYEFTHIQLQTMERFRFEGDVRLFEIPVPFKTLSRAISRVNVVERLPKTNVQPKADRRRSVVERNLPHVDMGSVGAIVEISKPVIAGWRIVKVLIGITIERQGNV